MRSFSQPGNGRGWEQISAGALVAALAVMLEDPSGEPIEKSFFITLVIFAGALIAYQLLAPSPQIEDARPAGLSDFTFPTTTQDRPVPIIVGTVRQRGANVNWYGDFEQRAVTEEISSGFFSSSEVIRGFQYFVGMSFAVCRGDDDTPVELLRTWINEDEVFNGSIPGEGSFVVDEPELFGGQDLGQGGVNATVSWRPGTTTQTVNAYLDSTGEQQVGGQTPRYTGLAYAMVEKGYIGNSTSVAPWSFEVRRIPNGLGLAAPTVNSGNDANLMNWAFEILTNQEWGYKFPAADIDTAGFTAAALTLAGEGNGVSMIIDSEIDASGLLDEVMRQMSGVIFLDHRSGLWSVKLARDDYDIDTIPQLTSPLEVSEYKTGDWNNTTNIVTVAFVNRPDEYTEDTAEAQNMANALIQGDGTVLGGRAVPGNVRYPGVKTSLNASNIATRELLTRSRPLIRAKISVTREFWDVTPGSVIAWTDDRHNGQKIAFRITRINYGRLRAEAIVLEIIEDIFGFTAGIFGPPPPTMWSPPAQVPVNFQANQVFAVEAPRAIAFRASGGLQSYVWATADRVPSATKFQIHQRNAPTLTAELFIEFGSSFGFGVFGALVNAVSISVVSPVATIEIEPLAGVSTQAEWLAALATSNNTADIGTNLINLMAMGDADDAELMLCESGAANVGNVDLTNVYRGVMDSSPNSYAAGTLVILMVGNVTSGSIPATNECEIKLLPESRFGVPDIGSAPVITIDGPNGDGMDLRIRRPYPPSQLSLEGVVYAASVSFEANGSGPEDFSFDVSWLRRDYRTADGGNEIAALTVDAATLFPGFPATPNNNRTRIAVINDPDGAATPLFVSADIDLTSDVILRIDVLALTDGILPTRMQIQLDAVHDEGGLTDLVSRSDLAHDFDTTSALTGQFEFGARDEDVQSNLYTATVAGTYNYTLSSSLGGGNPVQSSINGGAFGTTITGGNTTGSEVLAVNDTLRVRHRSSAAALRVQLDIDAPGVGQDGFFICVNP